MDYREISSDDIRAWELTQTANWKEKIPLLGFSLGIILLVVGAFTQL